MKTSRSMIAAFVLVTAAAMAFGAIHGRIGAELAGFEEPPAVSTVASGEFHGDMNDDETAITYSLQYADLEGIVTQAHIHVGQRAVNGGVSVFLCANPPVVSPAGTQLCPASPATITGTITPANVIGPTGQGLAPMEFAELTRAIRAGQTYVNVHSTKFPGGEIRGQIDHDNAH